jgi:hypothetical protein
VPPFKAFGEIAQDLIADAILGVSAHMGDNSQPARRFVGTCPKTPEISGKIERKPASGLVDAGSDCNFCDRDPGAAPRHWRDVCRQEYITFY